MDGNPIPNGVLVMIDHELTDPGEVDNANPEYGEDKKTPNSKVKSPQTSENMTVLYIGALVVLMILVVAAVLVVDELRSRRKAECRRQ